MRKESLFCAKDIMSTNLVMARPEMTSQQLEAMLVENKISGAPVVDHNGELVGVISMADIIASGEKLPIDTYNYFREAMSLDAISGGAGYNEEILSNGFVSDYMSRQVFTAYPDTPLDEIARKMYEERIHRVIIVEPHSNKPTGIVTTFDLLKVMAEIRSPRRQPSHTR